MSAPTVLPFVGRAEDNLAYVVNRTNEKINYIEITAIALTYRQTWTYTGDYVTAVSAWAKQ